MSRIFALLCVLGACGCFSSKADLESDAQTVADTSLMGFAGQLSDDDASVDFDAGLALADADAEKDATSDGAVVFDAEITADSAVALLPKRTCEACDSDSECADGHRCLFRTADQYKSCFIAYDPGEDSCDNYPEGENLHTWGRSASPSRYCGPSNGPCTAWLAEFGQ